MKTKRVLSLLLVIALCSCACSNQAGNKTPTSAPTSGAAAATATATPSPSPTPTPTPFEAFDSEGRALAPYGTPKIDGVIDSVWDISGVITPEVFSSPSIEASAEFRVLWDDTSLYTLYVVTDPVLNKDSANTYEQDSIELFLDELNDKASSYQDDDVHYRVNFDNEPSADAGDATRWSTAATPLTDASGAVSGYIVESAYLWSEIPDNDSVFGFELQVNDASINGMRAGTINIFDATGNAWSNPSLMGELILTGKSAGDVAAANPSQLKGYLGMVEKFNLEGYANPEVIDAPVASAKEILNKPNATQKEYDDAFVALKEALASLNDGSGFVSPSYLLQNAELPDTLSFLDGTQVTDVADWELRAEELRDLYQYYMYGVYRDGTDEKLTYQAESNKLKITIEREGNSAGFEASVYLPDASKVKCPEGGWPVIIAFGWLSQIEYANSRGYAVITLDTNQLAADNISRKGAFYDVYPYGRVWTEQTGTLLGWSWGISKVLDSLEAGASIDYNINPANNIITGVSRWGKAAAVCGAFDSRIRVCAPACSGAGGMATFRYESVDQLFDYSSVGGPSAYKMSSNEPLSSLQSSGERQWFNDTFTKISSVEAFPFDQYMLASLCAAKDRYLFIIAAYQSDDWTNPPAMYMTYLKAKEVFDFLGCGDNIAVQMHREGHAVLDEDMVYLLDYTDYHLYGKKPASDLSKLTSTVYALEENHYDAFYNLLK